MDSLINDIDIDILINNCITHEYHMEIALVIYTLLKDKYKYIGENKWEYYYNNIWKIDKNNNELRNDINNIVCNKFLIKSIEWFNKYNIEIDSTLKYTYKYRYDTILDIVINLKTKKYASNIIKESKQFFILQK